MLPSFLKNIISKRQNITKKGPDFIIIGAQKSGTTALFYLLQQHSEIIGSKIKETDFFFADKFYENGIKFYEDYFEYPSNKNLLGFEASPAYLLDDRMLTAERIYNYNPKIKLICILRNPIERAFSGWNMHRKKANEKRSFFIEWLTKRNYIDFSNYVFRTEKEINNFHHAIIQEINAIADNKKIEMPQVSYGLYYQQLQQYTNLFSSNQLLFLSHEELKNNLYNTLNKILHFLGKEQHDWKSILKHHTKSINQGNYESTLSDESILLLKEFYKEENKKLFKLIGKDYNW